MVRHARVVLLTLALFFLLPSPANAGSPNIRLRSGNITLVNGTPYDWRSSDVRSSSMTKWKFPAVIKAGTTGSATVEYRSGYGSPSGEVTFSLEGTDLRFKLAGRGVVVFDLKVELTNLSTLRYSRGSTINLGSLGRQQSVDLNFILAGELGSFTSNQSRGAWMHENLGVLGDRSLRHLCIPGAHDAGMSQATSATDYANDCNTVTQVLSVLGQLQMGVRYFDIRPVINRHGQFDTGHYSKTSIAGWQGANGQSLATIIDNVNSYTAANQELIVLHLSHDLNTQSYQSFTQNEWNRLFSELMGLNYRFRVVTSNPSTVDLTTLRLKDFIDSEPAVVIVVEPGDPHITLGSFTTEGFYTLRNFPVFNQYSATDEPKRMAKDQLDKLQSQRSNPDAGYFLLSWTLTQADMLAAACNVGYGSVGESIVDLSRRANPSLYASVLPLCSGWTYPNILYTDAVANDDVAALAMAVNSVAARSKPQEYVIYKGSGGDTGIYVAHSQDSNLSNGSAWNLVRMNGAVNTSDTPGTVSFAGGVYVLYKGSGNDPRIYVAHPGGGNILDGGAWNANPLNPAINTSTAPGIAVLQDTPYMLYKGAGADTNVYIARSAGNHLGDGNSWSANRLNPAINTSNAPAVAAFGGVLYLVYEGSGDSNIWIGRPTGDVFDGATWTLNRLNPGINTDTAPGAVVYKGDLYVFYKGFGSDTNIYIARSTGSDVFDGATWTYARLNPGINTTAAPKPVVVGDFLYLFYKGSGDDNIWIAEPRSANIFDGNAWHWERLNPAINTSTGPGAATTW